jgi:hypothetical protein
MKTRDEIRELINCYKQVADNTFYTDNTRRAALRKVNSLRAELGIDPIELEKTSEEPKAPEVTGIGKWFKTT